MFFGTPLYKKYVCIATIFASQKKCLFGVIQPTFSLCNIFNNLFWKHVRGICTIRQLRKAYFLFKWSTRLLSIYNAMVRAGCVSYISLLFHTSWQKFTIFFIFLNRHLSTPAEVIYIIKQDVRMFPIAGQTVGPNGLTFLGNPEVSRG